MELPQYKAYNTPFPRRVGIRNISDYSPYGVLLKERTVEGEFFRRSFNGMETDPEVKGKGNSYDFGARMLDSRVGRWLSIDKKSMKYPEWTPYKYALNDPLNWIDVDGNEEFPTYADYKAWAEKNQKPVLTHDQMHKQGHWLHEDLVAYDKPDKTTQGALNYRHANYRNLLKNDPGQYKRVFDRLYFYHWADNYFKSQGHEVKWMYAATSTILNLYLLHTPIATSAGYSNEEINKFIERGNKLILDDMMSRMKSLDKVSPLKGSEAMKWDAQTLSDEQKLIQKEYNKLSDESIKLLQSDLKSFENFEGDITDAADRWVYGMKKMGYEVTKDMMPVYVFKLKWTFS